MLVGLSPCRIGESFARCWFRRSTGDRSLRRAGPKNDEKGGKTFGRLVAATL
jgi:hypothetical protein